MVRTQKAETSEASEPQTIMIEGRRFFGLAELADRWGVSLFSVRRQVAQRNIRTINIGARLIVPAEEVLRIESKGVGERKRSQGQSSTTKRKAVAQ